jgi:hypothetical protein
MKMKRLSHGVGANVTGEEVGSSVLIITGVGAKVTGDKVGSLVGTGVVITSNGAGLGFSVALHTSKNVQTGSMMGTGYGDKKNC